MHERRMAGRTGRAVARPARVARTHAPRVLLAAVALLVVLLQVDTAYALPGSEKNSYPLGDILMYENIGANRGAVVYGAANEFFATLCLIGRKSDYLQLSNDQLAELSNEGFGGAFWELSQRWSNLGSDGPPENWPIGITLAMQGQGLISDPSYIWYADYSYYESDSLYNRALEDYLTIYNGGHLAGGSDSTFTLTCGNSGVTLNKDKYFTFGGTTYRPNKVVAGGVTYERNAPSFDVEFTDPQVNTLLEDDKYKLYIFTNTDSNYSYSGGMPVQAFITDIVPQVLENQQTVNGVSFTSLRYRFQYVSGSTTYFYGSTNTNNWRVLSYTGGKLLGSDKFIVSAPWNGTWSVINTSGYNAWSNVGVSSNPVIPPKEWPDPETPSPPDPPDVPEPDEPTGPGIDPPNPIGYTIDPTDDPDPVTDPYVVVVAPDSQDIIPWLRAILQAINNVGDKLNDESTELQRALNDVFFGNLSKLLKNIKGEFLQDFTQWLDLELEWMMESIESLFLDLQDYLHDLFEWLADQMNFEFDISTDPYDDTSLLNWLRRIYNKLGADGGPNTRPVDPSTDPEGFLDWLRRMIAEFIIGLGASASDFVSDLGDLLSRLFAKFPFSVPWDLLGILGLLDAAPVAPRANFTIPLTIGNSSFSWTIDINLTGWSTYMESVRTIILVSFISWLAWLTPSVLRDLDPGDFL